MLQVTTIELMAATPARRCLLVVDMSVEQCAALVHRKDAVVDAIGWLARQPGWALKLDSRLWLRSPSESTLSLVYPEWGDTMGVPDSEGAALIPELRGLGLEFLEKKHYSAFVDSDLLARLTEAAVDEVYVVGINTDYCIFSTALDAFARGRFRTHVVEDAVGSISGPGGHRQGLQWIGQHLGGAAVLSLDELSRRVSGAARASRGGRGGAPG